MKKTIAVIASVLMCAAVLAGCGKKTEDSIAPATETTTTTAEEVSSVEDTSSEDESTRKEIETNGDYAKAYTEKIAGGVYSIDAVINMPMFGETPMTVKVNGNDLYANITTLGVNVEVYQVDGKTYNMMPQVQSYMITESKTLQELGVSTYELPAEAKFLGSYEENGLIVEKFELPTVTVSEDISLDVSVDGGSYEAEYYFDNSGNLKQIKTEVPLLGETVFEVKNFSFDDVTIELPDLTDWTEMKEGEQLDKAATIKMGLSIYGVTEEMLTEAGYTYEQLAEMEEDEVTEIITKIAEDNGLTFELNN